MEKDLDNQMKSTNFAAKTQNNFLNKVKYTNDKQHSNERKRSNTPPESIRGQKIRILLPTQKSGSWIVLSKKRKTRNRKTTFSIWLTD